MRNIRILFSNVIVLSMLLSSVLVFNSCTSQKEDNRFLALLKLLPASASKDGCFFLIDYKILWKNIGVEFPSGNVSKAELFKPLIEKIIDANSPDSYPVGFSSYYTGWSLDMESPIQNKYVGYDIVNVDAEINNTIRLQFEFNTPDEVIPVPDLRVAAIGEFDPEATIHSLSNRDGWPDWAVESYNSDSYRGITIHKWLNGTDNHPTDAYSPPDLDWHGRAMPFAVSKNNLFVSDNVPNVKSMIDSSLGKSTTLAEVPEYALVAKGLHDLGSYVAIIGDEALANGQGQYFDDNKLVEFLTFGTGYSRDEKGRYVALVLVHDSVEKAKANAELLTTLAGQYKPKLFFSKSDITIYNTQIYNEGNVLLAKLYTDEPQLWFWWLIGGDGFLYHKKSH